MTAQLMAADRSPSEMSLMRAPAAADLGDQLLVARPIEDDDRHIGDLAAQARSAIGAEVLGRA